MNPEQRQEFVRLARQHISDDDVSHDFLHALRILRLSEEIAAQEGGDMDVVVPAALFHDAIIYPKDDPRSPLASIHSAELVRRVLSELTWFSLEKIDAVVKVVERCSFSKNIPKERIEEYIVQDADLLESLGAIAVARTFCSSGQMQRAFYHQEDPKAEHRELDPKTYALDLFAARLFKAKERLRTATAKRMAESREAFLHEFYAFFLKDIGL